MKWFSRSSSHDAGRQIQRNDHTETWSTTASIDAQERSLNAHHEEAHVYPSITLTDNARAIFGNVYTSCADIYGHLSRDEECRSMIVHNSDCSG